MSVDPTVSSAARTALCDAMHVLAQAGLNTGSAGNASVRHAAGFLITPSAVKPLHLRAAAIVAMDDDGNPLDPSQRPSSEWRFHRDIYRARADAGAVVHVHSPYATALACQRRDIPAFHYMVARAGGDSVRCAAYATFGTQALSDAALAALDGRRTCLLANHGMICVGATLERALDLTMEIEALARHYVLASASGEVVLLSPQEITDALERFKTYGSHHEHQTDVGR